MVLAVRGGLSEREAPIGGRWLLLTSDAVVGLHGLVLHGGDCGLKSVARGGSSYTRMLQRKGCGL